MIFASNAARISRILNSLALLGVTAILCFAFAWQFFNDDVSCPLCELQRAAFLLAGVGLVLNMRLGPAPMHYVMTIGAALGGMMVAGWQMVTHSKAGAPHFVAVMLEWPLYFWAFLAFAIVVAFCVVMLAVDRKWSDNALQKSLPVPALLVMVLFFLVGVAQVGTSVLGAAWGPCPQGDEYCQTHVVPRTAWA